MKICLIDETGTGDGALSVLAARWGLEHDEDNLMALVLTPEHLELHVADVDYYHSVIQALGPRCRPGALSEGCPRSRQS